MQLLCNRRMTSFCPRRTCLPLSRTVYRKIPPGMRTRNCFRRPFPSSSHTYTDQRGRLLKHSNRFLNTLSCFITGRNEVVAKVIFLHLSVIHSVHGGVYLVWSRGGVPGLVLGGRGVYLVWSPGGYLVWSRGVSARYTPRDQVHPPQNTANERPVRILLECILVPNLPLQVNFRKKVVHQNMIPL